MRLPPWASTMRPATAIPMPVPGFGAEPEVKGGEDCFLLILGNTRPRVFNGDECATAFGGCD